MRNLVLLILMAAAVAWLARALIRALRRGPVRPAAPAPGRDAPPVPPWAAFFTPDAYARFLAEVRAYFDRKRMHIAISDGILLCEHILEGRMGLVNIAQLCHQHKPDAWPAIIAAHFDNLQSARDDEQKLKETIEDFTAVSPLLAARIMPRDYLDDFGREKLVYREDLEGTITALVFDLPRSVRSVVPDEVQAWGLAEEDLFDVALRNVARAPAPAFSEQEIAPGVRIRLAVGDSHFTATHALLLEKHPDWIGAHGSLIGIPHRHAVLCLPIEDLTVLKALQVLIPAILGMHREGPGSISPHLYWYHDSRYMRLPFEIRDKTVNFTPPDEFVEMLNGLTEGEEGETDGDMSAL